MSQIEKDLEGQIESGHNKRRKIFDLLLNSGLVSSAAWDQLAQETFNKIELAYAELGALSRQAMNSPRLKNFELSTDAISELFLAIHKNAEQLQKMARAELEIPV